MTDFIVMDHGTIWVFRVVSERAMELAVEELELEPWQWVGDGQFAIDWRPARDLVEQLRDEGFVLRAA